MTDEYNKKAGENGVSESIGFLLIFSMVIVGIGLVTLYGYPMLLQQQTSADKQIMQKNMIVLQNDVKSLTYKTVPYKETMLNIGSGALTVYPSDPSLTPAPTSIISIREEGVGSDYVTDFYSGDLRYTSTSAGADISLQNGAVVMRNIIEPGSVMLAQPRWFYDGTTNSMVINLIALNSTDKISRSGVGNIQMTMGETQYLEYSPVNDVCLQYTPDSTESYQVAWDNYFVNTMKMTPGAGRCTNTNEYLLPFDYTNPAGRPLHLIIKKYDVNIMSL